MVESDLDGEFDQFAEFWRLFRSLQVVKTDVKFSGLLPVIHVYPMLIPFN